MSGDLSHDCHVTSFLITLPLVLPMIVSPPISSVVAMGTNIALRCVARGTPPPSVIWFKDNNPLINSGRVHIGLGTLNVTMAMASDSGTYACVAENRAGRTVSEAFIAVVTTVTSLTSCEYPCCMDDVVTTVTVSVSVYVMSQSALCSLCLYVSLCSVPMCTYVHAGIILMM